MVAEPTERGEGPLALTEEQRDVLQAEVEALLPVLSGERRQGYEALGRAVAQGTVPADLLPALEEIITLTLETGRARRVYRAEGERVLTDLFHQTPRGKETARQLAEVNRALALLRGHPLADIRVTMRTLGHFTLRLETQAVAITLAIRSHGVSVESVGVGGGVGGGP